MIFKKREFSILEVTRKKSFFSALRLRSYCLVRKLLWQMPYFYYLIYPGRTTLHEDYDLFVEGFPRSGNTFVARVFRVHFEHLKIHSHSHVPPRILRAIQDQKPILWIARDPLDCVPSWSIYTGIHLESILRGYIDCYSILLKNIDSVAVTTFDEVISKPGKAVQKINRRFHLNLKSFEVDEKLKTESFAFIDDLYKNEKGGVDEMRVARPSPERAKVVCEIQNILKGERYAGLLAQAQSLFMVFCQVADASK